MLTCMRPYVSSPPATGLAVGIVSPAIDFVNIGSYVSGPISRSVPLGAPAGDRRIVVCFTWGRSDFKANPTMVGASIQGIPLTILRVLNGQPQSVFIGIAHVPIGTSGNLEVSFTGGVLVMYGYSIHRLTSLHSSGTIAVASVAVGNIKSRSVNITYQQKGVIIACAPYYPNPAGLGWSGLTSSASDYLKPSAFGWGLSAGHFYHATFNGVRTITAQSNSRALIAASFR